MSQCRLHSSGWSLAQSSMAIMKQYLCYSLEASALSCRHLKSREEGRELPIEAESNFKSQSVEEDKPTKKILLLRTCCRWKENLKCIVPQVSFSNTTTLMLFFKSLRAIKDKERTVP